MHTPCEKYRNESDGVVNLRHQHCECYFKDQPRATEAHEARTRMFEYSKKTKSSEKVKSHSQSMSHDFFSPIADKHETSNENIEALPTVENDNNIE